MSTPVTVEGIIAPDSHLARKAAALAEQAHSKVLLNHVHRSWWFAEFLGRKREMKYDRELLYIASLLHDLGLSPSHAADKRFEVDGATADPVESGLVASLNRPGGNVTGVSLTSYELMPKQLGILHDLLPGATRIALLIDPNSPQTGARIARMRSAAASIGRQIEVASAGNNRDIDASFATLAQKKTEALIISPTGLFGVRRTQILTLAARRALPTMYPNREFVVAGGLMSYGPDFTEQTRQLGIYVGRILKGDKPADLPVLQPTKFELVINRQTARALDIEVPETLLATADEVIE